MRSLPMTKRPGPSGTVGSVAPVSPWILLSHYPWVDVHEMVSQAAKRADLRAIVHLLPEYQRAGLAAVRTDVVHPNARGHEIAVRQIAATIDGWGVLAGVRRTTG
jgi:hypothetical protein